MSESFGKNLNFQEKKDETLETKLKLIESVGCGLAPKSMMVLVALGLKPATTLDLFTWNEDVDSVKNKIKEAGLFYDDIQSPPFTNKKRTASLAIGSTKDLATKTAIAFRDPQKYHKELGEYMGYPKTAIDAFIGKTALLEDNEKILKDKEWPKEIMGFAFSKDYYEEELKVIENWWNAIKENTPDLYKQIKENEGNEEDDEY